MVAVEQVWTRNYEPNNFGEKKKLLLNTFNKEITRRIFL